MKRILTGSLAMAALALSWLSANAAGPFDGTWQVDSGGFGTPTAEAMKGTSCQPETLRFEAKDNQIQGSLARVPGSPSRVESNEGRRSSPISGTVSADGTVTARWEGYTATGKITGDKVELHWKASCGPRVAMGSRIGTAAESGSTTGR
jgi:hypothetical protein